MDNLCIRRKSGVLEAYSSEKIKTAIKKASVRESIIVSDDELTIICNIVENQLLKFDNVISIDDVRSTVLDVLHDYNHTLYLAYRAFKDYKQKSYKSLVDTYEFTKKLSDERYKENANKASELISTRMTLVAEKTMAEMYMNFDVDDKLKKADEKGALYIHDRTHLLLDCFNCCIFDIEAVLNNGFEINGVFYSDITDIHTALTVAADIIIQASSCQFGGFSISEVDYIFEKYCKSTLEKNISKYHELFSEVLSQEQIKELALAETNTALKKGYRAFETKVATINNALGQTTFTTISFGRNTSYWGRAISKTILNQRLNGLGSKHTTPLFPKLVLVSSEEFNTHPDSANYDIYQLALRCQRERIYPDLLSIDAGYVGDMYKKHGVVITPMGCRAFLSEYDNSNIFVGRNNIGAVSLNLPYIALEARSIKHFIELLREYSDLVFSFLNYRYVRLGKQLGSSNPLYYVHGGAWKSVGLNDPVAPVLEAATASLGYVGLNEAVQALSGQNIVENQELAYDIMLILNELVSEAKAKYNRLFALYATPAEALVGKFQKKNRAAFGIIENVTSSDYLTNSYHVHVKERVTPFQKIDIESQFFHLSTGGRIVYVEMSPKMNVKAQELITSYAVKKGLYFGSNFVVTSCTSCGNGGIGEHDIECPRCGSTDLFQAVRICGYISPSKLHGESRACDHKMVEINERVKHSDIH